MDQNLKLSCGIHPGTPDDVFQDFWDDFMANRYKPCAELRWCPYGPLVEDFPLAGETGDGPDVDCMVFGHLCPAFEVAEPFIDARAAYPLQVHRAE